MQLPCTFCLRLQLASCVDTDTWDCPASQQLVMVPMVPDVCILGLYRTTGVPEDMDSSVDDYAAASSVDEYTAGSATGDKHHQHATAAMQPASFANLCAGFGTAVLSARLLVHSSNVLQLVLEGSSNKFDRDMASAS